MSSVAALHPVCGNVAPATATRTAAAAGCTELHANTAPTNLTSRDFQLSMGFDALLSPDRHGPGRAMLTFRRVL